MYSILSSSKERLSVQNSCLEGIWNGFEIADIVALEAPTGFGKTFVALGLAKRFVLEKKQMVLVATAATNHTINFWKDHLKQESFALSAVELCFLIGKANQTFKPCFFLNDWIARKSKEALEADNIYSLCDYKKGIGECVHYSNVSVTQTDGSKVLTPEGEIASKQLAESLSDFKKEYKEKDLIMEIEKLKENWLCPYYLFKQNFSDASVKVCDFQYLINPSYLDEKTNDFLLVIDEFDKFEERLKEQFKIELSLKKLQNILVDLSPQNRDLFKQAFTVVPLEKKRLVFEAIEKYVSVLQDFFSGISVGLSSKEPKGIELEKSFFGIKSYKESFFRFNSFFKENKESFLKIISNAMLKKNPYRHLLAFHYRLELSLQQKDAISFVEFVQKKQKENYSDIVLVRRPLVFTEFYYNLAKRYDKVLVMSATLPFQEMLKINFGQKVERIQVPKTLGFTGKKQGIILKNSFFDFSSKKRGQDISVKTEMIADLLEELSRVKKEIVVFFNSYSSLYCCRNELFEKLERKGFKIFLDAEKKEDSNHNRDRYWQEFSDFGGKKVMFSSMYTKYARGSNILKGNGCRIQVLIGIPYPRIYPFELEKFDELAKKHSWSITASTWYYILNTRQTYTQVIGRLTRSKNDYGYFVVLSNKAVDRIMDKEHRSALDIKTETTFVREVTESAKLFFDTIQNNHS